MGDQENKDGAPATYTASPSTMIAVIGLLLIIFALVIASSVKTIPEEPVEKKSDEAVECSEICKPHGVLRWKRGECTCQEASKYPTKDSGNGT